MVFIGLMISMCMEKFECEFIKQIGVKLIVGKGGMGLEMVVGCQEGMVVYVIFFGGCVVLVVMQVEEIEGVEWQDFGMLEILWINWVKEFGLLIILIDIKGNNFIQWNKEQFNVKKCLVFD